MAATNRVQHTGNHGLFIIGTVFYLSFIALFLWQTAEFVSWLFPADQIIYRVITVAMFDVMAVFWAVVDTFYKFATRSSHNLVKWAWTISFIASLVASVFYMVLQSFTRLNFTPDISWVDSGFAIVIAVTVIQILMLTFWIRQEWLARHPKTQDYFYDFIDAPVVVVTPEPVKAIAAPAPAPAPAKSIDAPVYTTPAQRAPKMSKVTVQPPFSQPTKKALPRMHHAKYIVNKHPKQATMGKVALANERVIPVENTPTKNTRRRGSSGKGAAQAPGKTTEN